MIPETEAMLSMNWLSVTIKVTLTLFSLIILFLLNKQKISYPDFYQARIVQLSDILRLFLLTYKQTLRRIFICSSFLFPLHFSALSNKIYSLLISTNDDSSWYSCLSSYEAAGIATVTIPPNGAITQSFWGPFFCFFSVADSAISAIVPPEGSKLSSVSLVSRNSPCCLFFFVSAAEAMADIPTSGSLPPSLL